LSYFAVINKIDSVKVILAFILTAFIVFNTKTNLAQVSDPFIQSIVGQVSYDTLQSKLLTLESFGRKQADDPALELTAEWLMNTYSAYGYTDIQTDPFTLFNYETRNIIITKQGTEFPDTYLIIDGHYDTKTGPGVNDNGSGVAIILEIARLLHDIPTRYSIKFINFTAEEYGMVGSSHYVNQVVIPQNMDIRLVYNIDEVGGVAGITNNTVVCERDESLPASNDTESWAFTDTLATLTGIYSNLEATISYAYGSDYVPFQTNGEIITGIFEDNYSPYAHTVNDTYANLDMDYVFEMAKLSAAAAMYFAQAIDTGTGILDIQPNAAVEVYPNPFTDYLTIHSADGSHPYQFLLYDETGNEILNTKAESTTIQTIITRDLKKGFYMYQVRDDNGMITECGKLIRLK
jgi:aminopeptidase YwaD